MLHDATVLSSLRVQHAAPARQPLRLAICKLFTAQPMQGCMQVAKPSCSQATRYAILWAYWAVRWSKRQQAGSAIRRAILQGVTPPVSR